MSEGFSLDNLPFGIVQPPGAPARAAVAFGTGALDLDQAQRDGLLDGLDLPPGLFAAACLNGFLALGPAVWERTRARIRTLLEAGRGTLRPLGELDPLLPFEVADYVDFYASEQHVRNVGRVLRPDAEPLPPAWKYLPIGYHGRSATVVVSGSAIPRPAGMIPGPDGPRLGLTTRLDLEMELGFVVGVGNRRGTPISAAQATDHVFGVVVVNDWSARDIQAFEYQPLGPFLGKSFATSISPWVVPLSALTPYRVAGPPQQPPPAAYLACDEPRGLDVKLELSINASVVSTVSAASLYWSMAQQLAHLTVNGAATRTGDLFATGTISGEGGQAGSLIELTDGGRSPLTLTGGSTRSWLEDGDVVTIRGWCGGDGRPLLDLGQVTGTILARTP